MYPMESNIYEPLLMKISRNLEICSMGDPVKYGINGINRAFFILVLMTPDLHR